MIPLTKNYFTN